jgi:hypothetical protein
MTEQNSDTGRAPLTGRLATVALALNIIALIASTICLASFVLDDVSVAAGAGATSLMTFVASMASHAVDRRQQARGQGEVFATT